MSKMRRVVLGETFSVGAEKWEKEVFERASVHHDHGFLSKKKSVRRITKGERSPEDSFRAKRPRRRDARELSRRGSFFGKVSI